MIWTEKKQWNATSTFISWKGLPEHEWKEQRIHEEKNDIKQQELKQELKGHEWKEQRNHERKNVTTTKKWNNNWKNTNEKNKEIMKERTITNEE